MPMRSMDRGAGSWNSAMSRSASASAAPCTSTTSSGGRPPALLPSVMMPRVGWKRKPTSRAARMLSSTLTSLGKMYRWSFFLGGGSRVG